MPDGIGYSFDISHEFIQPVLELQECIATGMTKEQAVRKVRESLVPAGYKAFPFR